MKTWALKNKSNAYLCKTGEDSYKLLFAENGYINGNMVLEEKKKYLDDIMEWVNEDLKPECKVKPVQIEVQFKINEIKKEDK